MKQTDHEKRPAPGQIVHVVIDRPMNTYHPEHKDLFYPVNYGYIGRDHCSGWRGTGCICSGRRSPGKGIYR